MGSCVSGRPLTAVDCSHCSNPAGGLDLISAGRHRFLRGTPWLKSKKLGTLRVCRHCERLWSESYDHREHYTWHRDLGVGSLALLAADATADAVVAWASQGMPSTASRWPSEVLRQRLRLDSRPLQRLLDACLATLAAPITCPGELAAERRDEVIRLILVVLERACEPDLRPRDWKQPRARAPSQDQIAAVCREYPVRRVGDAFLGKTAGTTWRLAFEAMRQRASSQESVLLATNAIGALIDAALAPPMTDETRGEARRYRRADGWNALVRVSELTSRPGNAHVLAMPEVAWRSLDEAIEPVSRLASAAAELFDAQGAPTRAFADIAAECAPFMVLLSEYGARLSPATLARLEPLIAKLDSHSQTAADPLRLAVHTFRNYAATDCAASTGECADPI